MMLPIPTVRVAKTTGQSVAVMIVTGIGCGAITSVRNIACALLIGKTAELCGVTAPKLYGCSGGEALAKFAILNYSVWPNGQVQ